MYEKTKHENLESMLFQVCNERHIIPTKEFLLKCIELYETKIIRHGLMLVGPTGSGKTKVFSPLDIRLSHLSFLQLSKYIGLF